MTLTLSNNTQSIQRESLTLVIGVLTVRYAFLCFRNNAQWPHVVFTKQTSVLGNNSNTCAQLSPARMFVKTCN